MDFLTVALRETLYAVLQIVPHIIFIGAIAIAMKWAEWRMR
jgi:hypothetical protein